MVGRLIVAALVVASAAFVMLQKRATESTDIEANLSDTRARAAASRVQELEDESARLREQLAGLERELAWERGQLDELAGDCTPALPEGPEVRVAKLAWGPAPAPNALGAAQHARLLLSGDGGTVTRLRLYNSLDDGTPLNGFSACDTLPTGGAMLLGVVSGGRDRVSNFGPQRLEKRAGTVAFELVCDADLVRTQPLSVEVLLSGGARARATVAPAEAPPPRR